MEYGGGGGGGPSEGTGGGCPVRGGAEGDHTSGVPVPEIVPPVSGPRLRWKGTRGVKVLGVGPARPVRVAGRPVHVVATPTARPAPLRTRDVQGVAGVAPAVPPGRPPIGPWVGVGYEETGRGSGGGVGVGTGLGTGDGGPDVPRPRPVLAAEDRPVLVVVAPALEVRGVRPPEPVPRSIAARTRTRGPLDAPDVTSGSSESERHPGPRETSGAKGVDPGGEDPARWSPVVARHPGPSLLTPPGDRPHVPVVAGLGRRAIATEPPRPEYPRCPERRVQSHESHRDGQTVVQSEVDRTSGTSGRSPAMDRARSQARGGWTTRKF